MRSQHLLFTIDPVTHSLTLLAKLPNLGESDDSSNAIIRIEKTALSSESVESMWADLAEIKLIEHTDIVSERSKPNPQPNFTVVRSLNYLSMAGYLLG